MFINYGTSQNTYINGNGGNVGIGTIWPTHLLQMGDWAYETGGTWTNASDRNLKTNFRPVRHRMLLAKLSAILMTTWNYKSEQTSIRHLGPMAQDFYAAFGLGEDDKLIPTVDEGGVALAGVQALYCLRLEKDAQLRKLAQQNDQLAKQNQELAAEVQQLRKAQEQMALAVSRLAHQQAGQIHLARVSSRGHTAAKTRKPARTEIAGGRF